MANSVDKVVEKLSRLPWFSIVTVGPATIASHQVASREDTTAGLVSLTFMAVAGAPVCVWMATAAAVNLFRDRSRLSKAFSTVSGTASAIALPYFVNAYAHADEQKLLVGVPLMALGVATNLAAHFTRNVGLKTRQNASQIPAPTNDES